MQTVAVVLTNSSIAKFFTFTKSGKKLDMNLMEERLHPESRMKGIDLRTDGPGHYSTSNSTRGAYANKTSAKEVEMEHFALEIVNAITDGLNNNRFQAIILVTPPQFYGLLNKHLPKHIEQHIKQVIQKDYTTTDEKEIEAVFMPLCRSLLLI